MGKGRELKKNQLTQFLWCDIYASKTRFKQVSLNRNVVSDLQIEWNFSLNVNSFTAELNRNLLIEYPLG